MKGIRNISVPYICKFCYVSIDRLQITSKVLCDVYGPWIIWVVFSVIFKHTLSVDQCLITPLTQRSCGLSNLKHRLLSPLHIPYATCNNRTMHAISSHEFKTDCWLSPWPLILNLEGIIWNSLYLRNNWSNCHEMKVKHINWIPGIKLTNGHELDLEFWKSSVEFDISYERKIWYTTKQKMNILRY